MGLPLSTGSPPASWVPPRDIDERIVVIGGIDPSIIGATGTVRSWLSRGTRVYVRLDCLGTRSLAITDVSSRRIVDMVV